ncbi:MAG TPA: cysteine--tRNA ligase, partial [Smithella sp.]|nr:cysteine--tRNA ligase [Smithella sp.]
HYRSPVDYSDSALNETRSALLRVYTALKLVKDVLQKTSVDNSRSDREPSSREEKFGEGFGDLADKFNAAMDDDFNTAQALGYVFETVRRINHIGADKHMSPPEKARKLSAARGVMDYFASVLGVFHSDADAFFLSDRDKELRKQGLNAADIEALVEQRNAARAAKDWATADAIRAQLAQHHIVLKDAAGQTSWMIE